MPLFRRRSREDRIEDLLVERAQLLAELEALDADAAWSAASDDALELEDARQLRRQADALRRAVAEIDRRVEKLRIT